MQVLPYLEMIEQGRVEFEGQELPVVDIKVIPGYLSEPEMLEFEWNVTAMTKRMITFQINFKTAKYVSAYEEPDRIRITFNDRYMFVSDKDLAIVG